MTARPPESSARLSAVAAEAIRSARAQPVASTLLALVSASLCLAIVLTVGQTVRAEQVVLGRLDTVQARTVRITITDPTRTPFADRAAIGRLNGLSRVAFAVGLSAVTDAMAAALPDGSTLVPTRSVIGPADRALRLTAGRWPTSPDEVVVGAGAQQTLRLTTAAGAIVENAEPIQHPVVGSVAPRPAFEGLDAYALRLDADAPLREVVVVARDVADVSEVAEVAQDLLAPDSAQVLSVQTSADLGQLRDLVAGDLGSFRRSLLALVLGAGIAVVFMLVFGIVGMRRTDLGRRRVLGASRPLVMGLILLQMAVASLVGIVVGLAAALAIVWQLTGGLVDLRFVAGTAILVLLGTLLGAAVPALVASRRDPILALRVP